MFLLPTLFLSSHFINPDILNHPKLQATWLVSVSLLAGDRRHHSCICHSFNCPVLVQPKPKRPASPSPKATKHPLKAGRQKRNRPVAISQSIPKPSEGKSKRTQAVTPVDYRLCCHRSLADVPLVHLLTGPSSRLCPAFAIHPAIHPPLPPPPKSTPKKYGKSTRGRKNVPSCRCNSSRRCRKYNAFKSENSCFFQNVSLIRKFLQCSADATTTSASTSPRLPLHCLAWLCLQLLIR